VILAAIIAAAALAFLAVRHVGGELSVGRLEELSARNFHISPPHHLTTLITPGEQLIVRPRNIDGELQGRLEFRLRITAANKYPRQTLFSPYASDAASYEFSRPGQYALSIDARDTQSGCVHAFRLTHVYVGPASARSGMSIRDAINRVGPSKPAEVLKQTAAVAIFLALGVTTLAMFRRRLSLSWLMFLSLPVGVGVWVCLSLAVLIVHLKYSAPVMGVILAVYLGLTGWRAAVAGQATAGSRLGEASRSRVALTSGWSARDVWKLLLYSAGVLAAAALLAWFDVSMLMWDSWRYVIFGKRLAFFGGLEGGVNYPQAYGVLTALTQSICVFLRFEFFGVLLPLVFLSAMGLLACSLFDRWRVGGRRAWTGAAFVAIVIIAVVSTYMARASAVWLLPNSFAGIYLLGAIIVLERAMHGGDRVMLGLGALFVICFALCRIEGPIVALMVLAACLLIKRPGRDELLLLYVPYFVFVAAWYATIWIAFDIGGGSEFLTVPKVVFVLGLNAAFLATVIAARRHARFYELLRPCVGFVPWFLLAVGIGVGLKNHDQAATNLLSIVENLFAGGYWGAFWPMVVLLAIFAPLARRFRGERFLRFTVVSLILLTFDMFLFRPSALRVHVMDSGNRMFLHLYLLIIYYLGCKFAAAGGAPNGEYMEKQSTAGDAKRPGRAKRILTGVVILAVTLAVLEGAAFIVLKYVYGIRPYTPTIGETPVQNPYHPYLGWENRPNADYDTSRPWIAGHKTFIRTDSRGRSITPLTFEKPDIVIIMTGGSTVFGYGASGNDGTIPSQLEKLIHDRLGVRAEVVNLAGVGYQSFQEMLMLNRYLADGKADLVLVVSGHNDAYYAAEQPQIESAFLTEHVWRDVTPMVRRAEKGHIVNAGNFPGELAPYSSIFALIHTLRRQRAEHIRRNVLVHPVREVSEVSDSAVARRAKIALTHYAAMASAARNNNARFKMFLQPVGWSKKLSDEEKQILARVYSSPMGEKEAELLACVQKKFYGHFRKSDKSFEFVDISALFDGVPETFYVDHCHYNDRGAGMIAEAILKAIRGDIEKRLGRSPAR